MPGVQPDRALGSDPHDFASLYMRHRQSFGFLARRFLHDPRDVDEVVQETFLRLFLALPELETELQALAWCRRATGARLVPPHGDEPLYRPLPGRPAPPPTRRPREPAGRQPRRR
ncbi:MAG: hypothetical protein LC640_06130 [Frankia sp.]|nr:hypothetical protein [Frankia sp.]